MCNVNEIYRWIEALVGGELNKDEDLITFGTGDLPVRKIMVCWMPDVAALSHAAEIGANLVIVHESPFYPYDVTAIGGVPTFMNWHANHRRIRLLAGHDMGLIRMHTPLDRHCIYMAFAERLGLGAPVADRGSIHKVFQIEPIPYGALIERVKKAVGMPVLRASAGDMNRIVSRVGMPWGGLGLFVNVAYMQELLDMGCDVMIAGETDNYGIRFAIDAGVDLIETGHEISENGGLRQFADELAGAFPELPVVFYENQTPFLFV